MFKFPDQSGILVWYANELSGVSKPFQGKGKEVKGLMTLGEGFRTGLSVSAQV